MRVDRFSSVLASRLSFHEASAIENVPENFIRTATRTLCVEDVRFGRRGADAKHGMVHAFLQAKG